MSDIDKYSSTGKDTHKGQPLGFLINRTFTPLQTRFTKPQPISPHISSVFVNSKVEGQEPLTSPHLYRFPKQSPWKHDDSGDQRTADEDLVKCMKSERSEVVKQTDLESVKTERERSKFNVESKEKERILQTHVEDVKTGDTSDTYKGHAPDGHDSLKVYLNSLEKQIVVHDYMEEKYPFKVDDIHIKSQHVPMSTSPKSYTPKKSTVTAPSRSHTDSVCSSCSVEDAPISHSRCSVCDGSSTASSSRVPAMGSDSGFLDHIDSILGSDLKVRGAPLRVQDPGVCEDELLRPVFGLEEFDASSCKCSCFASQTNSSNQHTRHSSGDSRVEKKSRTISLTKDQLVFLLQRVELSRFREIVVDKLADQDKVSQSQRRTLACLIQAVVVVSRRVHTQTDKWLKLQADIRQLQLEKKVYQQRQGRMTVCMCAILCLYLLNMKAVRRRLISVIKYFGIVETAKKVNRTRKMIGENWRYIPSLLTNFWRIFIFRSKSKLNVPSAES